LSIHDLVDKDVATLRSLSFAGRGYQQAGGRLVLTLGGRYDHTSDFGGKATWQGGLLWRATETLSLRGSYGVSFKGSSAAGNWRCSNSQPRRQPIFGRSLSGNQLPPL